MPQQLPPKGEADKRIGAYNAPLMVSAQDIPNMTVRIRAGSFFNTQNSFVEFSGGSSPVILAPTANAKWVIIALTDTGLLDVINGTASTSPSFPAVPTGHLPLAALFISSTSTSILPSQIVDIRPYLRSQDLVPNINDALADRPTITDMDNELALKADIDGTSSEVFHLNKDVTTGIPSQNASLAVDRGSLATVSIRWNESGEQWEFTNDGTLFSALGSGSGGGLVTSVNGDVGNVVLTAVDVGAAPIFHQHVASDVTNFSAAVATQIASSTFSQSQVTNLVSDLAGKAAFNHGHLAAQITDFNSAVSTQISLATFAQSQVIGLVSDLAGKAPSLHNHLASQITDFNSAVDARVATVTFDALADVAVSASVNGSFIVRSGSLYSHTNNYRVFEQSATTLDATPMYVIPLEVPLNSAVTLTVYVTALGATGDSYSSRSYALIKNVAGTTSQVNPTQTDTASDIGAASWSANVFVDDLVDAVSIELIGAGGVTIDWNVTVVTS